MEEPDPVTEEYRDVAREPLRLPQRRLRSKQPLRSVKMQEVVGSKSKKSDYRVREEDREPPSPTCSSTRFTTNKTYNPFSTTSKKMIQDVGNVELFELFETDPKTQCQECLSYWSEGIVYCTCGHLLNEIVANRGFIEYTLDLLSIPEYVIKKGRPHGHRYGKTPEKKEYHLAHNLKKRCIKRRFTGIHDRFLQDPDFRKSMHEHDRDEDVCLKWDNLAAQYFTYRMTESEYFHYRQNWWISYLVWKHWRTIEKTF